MHLKTDPGAGRGGVFGGVLQRLQAAEVHCRLGVLRKTPDLAGVDRHRQRRLAGLGAERRG